MKEERMKVKEKRKWQIPHVLVVITVMILISAVLTYLIPAGQFDRIADPKTGRTIVDATSYHRVTQNGISLLGIFEAIPNGIIDAASVIAIIFVYGGAFGIITRTGVIDSGIATSIDKMRKYSFFIIPMLMIIFSLLGAFLGICESVWAFLPLCVLIAKAMGYDAIVGFAMAMFANMMGFAAGPMNMWNVGIAQGIAELPLYSGLNVRLMLYVLFMVLTIGYVLIYANKIKKDPTKSLMYNLDEIDKIEDTKESNLVQEFPTRKKIVLAVVLCGFTGLGYGLIGLGWWSGSTIGGYLLGVSLLAALIDGLKLNEIAEAFIVGTRNVLLGALCVGLARGILIVLTKGAVIDTILNIGASSLNGLPQSISAVLIYLFQFLFNLLVPSGSAQAATTMPLIVPLADLIGITRQSAVLSFQLADGFSNLLWPTSILGALAIAEVPYEKWLKFILPFAGVFVIISIIIVVISAKMAFGPF